MTREEYETKIDEKLKAVKEELMSEYKEEEPSLDGWDYGETYYYIDDYGDVIKTHITCWNKGKLYGIDKSRLISNNMFRTEQEAKFKRERNAVLYELSKYAEPKDAVWDGKHTHHYIYWDYDDKEMRIDYLYYFKRNDIYFPSKEDVEKAVAKVGEQRIRKYYLMVGDGE